MPALLFIGAFSSLFYSLNWILSNLELVWWFDCSSLHEQRVGLFLVNLIADVVDVGGEVVLGVVVDYVTDVREDQLLEYAVLQVFQEPVESDSKDFTKKLHNHKEQLHKDIQSFNWPSPDLSSGNDSLHFSFSFRSFGIFVPSAKWPHDSSTHKSPSYFPLSLSVLLSAISHLSLTSRTLRMLEKRVFLSLMIIVNSSSRLSRKCSVRTRRDRR